MDIDEFLERCSAGEFEVKEHDASLKTITVDEPRLLTSHELARVLLSLPDGFVRIMGSGREVLSVASSRLVYNENQLRERGVEIEIVTDETFHNFITGN
jgi:hypothetical protein